MFYSRVKPIARTKDNPTKLISKGEIVRLTAEEKCARSLCETASDVCDEFLSAKLFLYIIRRGALFFTIKQLFGRRSRFFDIVPKATFR